MPNHVVKNYAYSYLLSCRFDNLSTTKFDRNFHRNVRRLKKKKKEAKQHNRYTNTNENELQEKAHEIKEYKWSKWKISMQIGRQKQMMNKMTKTTFGASIGTQCKFYWNQWFCGVDNSHYGRCFLFSFFCQSFLFHAIWFTQY